MVSLESRAEPANRGVDVFECVKAQKVAASREYFRKNPEGGFPFDQVVADLGFTMDQVRRRKGD